MFSQASVSHSAHWGIPGPVSLPGVGCISGSRSLLSEKGVRASRIEGGYSPPPLLKPNGSHHMDGRHAGSMYPTGMLSCWRL